MENYATLPEHPAPGLKIHPTELKAQERRYLVNNDPFKGYIKESEPDKWEKGYAWHTAIGLQAVDGLKTSEYLIHTAVRNIEGEISFEEANALPQCDHPCRRKRIRFRPESLLFFQRKPSVLLQMSIFLFTGGCSLVSIPMPGASGAITLPKRNGCLTALRYFTVALRS